MDDYPIGYKLSSNELENLVISTSKELISQVYRILEEYDRDALFSLWLKFIRMQEELLNIYFELDSDELEVVLDVEIGSYFVCSDSFTTAKNIVERRFGKDVMVRFSNYVSMFSRQNFILNSIGHNYLNLKTIGDLVVYTQSRRLYYVTILHLIPQYAKGSKHIRIEEIPNEFGAYIDFNLRNVTTGFHTLILSRCIENFSAVNTLEGLDFSHSYNQLESLYLEPIRLSSLDILQYDSIDPTQIRPTKRKYSLYSFEELDDTVRLDAVYFADYDLNKNKTYLSLLRLIDMVKPFFLEDYSIVVPVDAFEHISIETGLKLYSRSKGYFDLLNTREAFVQNGDFYYSSFYLFQRYIENTIYRILHRNKRYQIKSGFIFEQKVTSLLERYGYHRISDVKRINHKEFDVICKKDRRIYNFQCKNNYFNAQDIDTSKIAVFVRYHKHLSHYYDNALKKEQNREELLKGKVGDYEIENFVVSRFPVITSNNRVIPYNMLESWIKNRIS